MVESKHVRGHRTTERTCNNSYDPNCNKLHQLLGNSALLVRSPVHTLPSLRPHLPVARLLIAGGGWQQQKVPSELRQRGRINDYVGGPNGWLPRRLALGHRCGRRALLCRRVAEAAATPRDQQQSQEKISAYVEPTSGLTPGKVCAADCMARDTCRREQKRVGYKVYWQPGDVVRIDFSDHPASIDSVGDAFARHRL